MKKKVDEDFVCKMLAISQNRNLLLSRISLLSKRERIRQNIFSWGTGRRFVAFVKSSRIQK